MATVFVCDRIREMAELQRETVGYQPKPAFIRTAMQTLASLELTIVILTAITIALLYSMGFGVDDVTGAIKKEISHSFWFNGLLIALGVNLGICTFVRRKFGLVNLGYYVTHTGLLVILAGAVVTNVTKIDGLVLVAEGESTSMLGVEGEYEIVLDEGKDEKKQAFVYNMSDPHDVIIPLKLGDVTVTVQRVMPSAMPERDVIEGGDSYYPTVQLEFSNARGDTVRNFLVPLQEAEIANFKVIYGMFDERIFEFLSQKEGSHLFVSIGSVTETIPVESMEVKEISGYRVKIVAADADTQSVKFSIAAGDKTIEFIANSFHSIPIVDDGKQIGKAHLTPRIEGLFIAYNQEEKGFRIFVKDSQGPRAVRKSGETYSFAYEGAQFTLKILKIVEKPRFVTRIAEEITKDGEPCAVVTISDGTNTDTQCLSKTFGSQVVIGDRTHTATIRNRQARLGFNISLEKFSVEFYPGTSMAKKYESVITLTDPDTGLAIKTPIRVNEPINFKGYTIYQATYARTADKFLSGLQCNYDPGKRILYIGFVTAVVGVIYMFYVKPIVLKRRSAQ